MKIPGRPEKEGLLNYAERLSDRYSNLVNLNIRKSKGQIFTPYPVSKFMANLFKINKNSIRFLDPGAGTGILTAAFCERLLDKDKAVTLTIDAYENDPKLFPFLKRVLNECQARLQENGHSIQYNILKKDFILNNANYFRQYDLFETNGKRTLYDFVISNPPYYKLSKDSAQSTVMSQLVSGQPNIYALFMALSAKMLNDGGEMVIISPRSFCSGLYYRKFREWLLKNVQISNIHIFESRKEIFDKDEVLQENVIIKAHKKKNSDKKVIISTSKNKCFDKVIKIQVHSTSVISHKNGDIFIRIPASSLNVEILQTIDSWPNTLRDLGLEISTGPVVAFRARRYLVDGKSVAPESVPLLWMHNMRDMKVVWPLEKNKKESAIRLCAGSTPLLLPAKNYVLLNRFSSKEQKRRLYAAVLLESDFPYESLGIENHVNYIYKPHGNLSIQEAFGIASILNTKIVDNYFRSLNGNTQVNAVDIRSLPFPKIEDVKNIGKLICDSSHDINGFKLDEALANILKIDNKIINQLNTGDNKYEQN